MATTELATTQSVSEFDNATDTAFLGKTDRDTFVFTGVASNRWSIGDVPNGGYVMSIIIGSVIRHFAAKHQTDPVALNCFFFSKTIPGNLIIEIDELKMSRKGYCVVRAILKQRKDLQVLTNLESYDPTEWIDKVQGIFTMGNMDAEEGVTYYYKNPEAPSLEHLGPYHYVFMGEFLDCEFDMRNFPTSEDVPGNPEVTQKIGFKDGRPIDFKSVPYWCDMFVALPHMLGQNVTNGPIWTPTMQLEVQFKRKPTGKKVIAHFITNHIINSRYDIDGEIWTEDGEILALTRHQNLIVPWSRNTKKEIVSKAKLFAKDDFDKSKL